MLPGEELEKEKAGPTPKGSKSNDSQRQIQRIMCIRQVAKY